MSTTEAASESTVAQESTVEEDEQPSALEKDDVFHILQTRRRRDALRYLKGTDEPVRMRDLAEQVAAWENETTVGRLSSDERQRVYISLYQSHLPKLDDEGVIEYNQSRGIVERTAVANQFDPYLETDEASTTDAESDREPDTYYFGAAFVSGLLLLGSATGITTMTGAALGGIVLTMFVAVTLVQVYARELLER